MGIASSTLWQSCGTDGSSDIPTSDDRTGAQHPHWGGLWVDHGLLDIGIHVSNPKQSFGSQMGEGSRAECAHLTMASLSIFTMQYGSLLPVLEGNGTTPLALQ